MDARECFDRVLERARQSRYLGEHRIDFPEGLEVQDYLVPAGWAERGNVALSVPGQPVHVMQLDGAELCRNSVVICCGGYRVPTAIALWGEQSVVFFGEHCHPADLQIYCGPRSTVIIHSNFMCTNYASINARNAGSVFVGPSNLWAESVKINTDDMHAILDVETGRRLNRYGSTVDIDARVWLGADVTVNPGASIGHDTVIGTRSVVTGDVPAHCVAVGVPTRVIRTGTTWSHEDRP